MSLDRIVDQFVNVARQSGANIIQVEQIDWIDALEQQLPKRLPASFRSLVTRYRFAPFAIGGIEFFANTGAEREDEFAVVIFRDSIVAALTLQSGFVQFAHPDTGSYDPICFDMNQRRQNREYPLVRLEHEALLIGNQIGRPCVIAPSFFQFIIGIIKGDKGNIS
jgi:hypothetical protein